MSCKRVSLGAIREKLLMGSYDRYGCHNITSHDLQRINYKLTEDLFAWKRSLVPPLQIDFEYDNGPVLPHLLMLQ